MSGVLITRIELTPAQLRAAAGKTKDARAARRMLAIALVLEGVDRRTAAATYGMDRQTLRDWVHRYNAEGLAGLVNRTVPHRPRRLAPARSVGKQLAALGFRRLSVRPQHPKSDPEAQAAFKKTSPKR